MKKATAMKKLSSFGNGVLDVVGDIAVGAFNGPVQDRIDEIDEEITTLQAERTKLENQLIKPD